MDGPTHYDEAQALLASAKTTGRPEDDLARAQVHATLALAAATAELTAIRYEAGMATGRGEIYEDGWTRVFDA